MDPRDQSPEVFRAVGESGNARNRGTCHGCMKARNQMEDRKVDQFGQYASWPNNAIDILNQSVSQPEGGSAPRGRQGTN